MDTPADGDDMDVIAGTEAVRLFTDRAAQHGMPLAWDERTAQVVGRICRRLDGIPLAIELAAARLRMMSVTELDARLDERFIIFTGGSRTALPRQRTLRALVDWSWELLNAAERQVLAPPVGVRWGVRPGRRRGGQRGPRMCRPARSWVT